MLKIISAMEKIEQGKKDWSRGYNLKEVIKD